MAEINPNWPMRGNPQTANVRANFQACIDQDQLLQDQITTNDAELANHESRISANEATLTDHETRITTNEGNITNHEGRITANEGTIADHETRITTNEGEIASNNTELADHETRITANTNKNNTQDSTLSNHESRISTNEAAIAALQAVVPVGSIMPYTGTSAPTGWLMCDGTAINAAYTQLRALVGANTPDLRGEFLRGWSSAAAHDPDYPRNPLTKQVDAFKKHNHNPAGNTAGRFYGDNGGASSGGYYANNTYAWTFTDGGGADETRPKNTAVTYIIKHDY